MIDLGVMLTLFYKRSNDLLVIAAPESVPRVFTNWSLKRLRGPSSIAGRVGSAVFLRLSYRITLTAAAPKASCENVCDQLIKP